jgi:hypothetical protein
MLNSETWAGKRKKKNILCIRIPSDASRYAEGQVPALRILPDAVELVETFNLNENICQLLKK